LKNFNLLRTSKVTSSEKKPEGKKKAKELEFERKSGK
jgi:hypothetical protein